MPLSVRAVGRDVAGVVPEAPHGSLVQAATWPPGLDASAPSRLDKSEPVTRFIERTQWVVDAKELRAKPWVYEHLVLPDGLDDGGRWRIFSPLLHLDGVAGLFVFEEPASFFELTFEDRDLLKTVGRHVATYLSQQEADRKLAESRQFDAYHRLTAFVMHDMKNSIAQLKLVVENSKEHRRNPDFVDDALDTVSNTVARMTRLLEQLRGSPAPSAWERVDLNAAARDAAARCADRAPVPQVEHGAAVMLRGDRERLTSVIEHVIRNAQEATPPSGTVSVRVEVEGQEARLWVIDTGQGMSASFVRERLFAPFDSTKGAKGMGIGAYQVREYVQALAGRVEVRSVPGAGTQFAIVLPVMGPPTASLEVADIRSVGETS